MKICKIRKVKTPSRGTSHSAGVDFFIPEFDSNFLTHLFEKNPDFEGNQICSETVVDDEIVMPIRICLYAGQQILIPSGIKAKIPEGYALIAKNKSGVASKKGITKMAELIDEDYQGEIYFNLLNTSKQDIYIDENEKIIQFILVPVKYNDIEEVSSLEELF